MEDYSDLKFDLEVLSEMIELSGGHDSVKTIKEKYGRTERGALKCPYPDCNTSHFDPYMMWRHVHFSKKHEYSFGISWMRFIGKAWDDN